MLDFRFFYRTLCLAGGLSLAAFSTSLYLDGPPPGHTGGFGEPTCHTCHFGSDLNPPDAVVMLEGLNGTYKAGNRYDLSVVLHSPDLVVGGFQLSARTTDGVNAGSFETHDVNTEVVSDTSGVRYIQHTRLGVENNPVEDGHVSWRFQWTAPGSDADSVVFSLAANAANGDNSAFGDEILSIEKIVEVQ